MSCQCQDQPTWWLVLSPTVKTPRQGHQSNSLDLYFDIGRNFDINPRTTVEVSLGIQSFTNGKDADKLFIVPRSSSSLLCKELLLEKDEGRIRFFSRSQLSMANTMGIIDWDYRGLWLARLNYDGNGYETLSVDKPYLQVFSTNPDVQINIVANVDEVPAKYRTTLRDQGSFGSSDKIT